MKNLKIGEKITLGFAWVCVLLLVIAATSVISALRTRTNIEKVEAYRGIEVSANELMHILNETRITAGVFYETHSKASFDDVSKQLMYCDFRLNKLYEYIGAHSGLASYKEPVDSFQELYAQWRGGVSALGAAYNLEDGLRTGDEAAFLETAASIKRINLLAHELLSNTILNMGDSANAEMYQAKSFSLSALYVVIVISVVSLAVAIPFAIAIMRSITTPMAHMRDVLDQIGRSGDLKLARDRDEKLQGIAKGRDETAQCVSALLHMVDHLRGLDAALEQVANGDLTVDVKLQSAQDTMGLAVKKMVENLNGKFATIASSTNRVHGNAGDLSEGSRLLASGSEAQSQSVSNLAASVHEIGDKTKRNTELANNASELISKIRANAQVGTEKMNQMMQAATEINEASQSIGKVIKTIDDIAFQTNILALNAAVEAARAGHEGKGFAVVADEVRNLANRSAEAAKESGVLIENTMQKAALGASIAELTSQSLDEIVQGVLQSNTMIADIASLSAEQTTGVLQAVTDVRHVEQIVEQNNMIAAESARSAGEIEEQSNLLKEMVSQFCLMARE